MVRGSLKSLVVCIVACGLGAGCGRKGPVVEFVEGVVILDGQAVEGASVGFSPLDAAGLAGNGRTDAAGKFRLTSTRGGKAEGGVPIGRYAVMVSKVEYDLGGKPPPEDGDYSNIPVKTVVPEDYGVAATSGLEVDVPPGGGSVDRFRFELSSKYKASGRKER